MKVNLFDDNLVDQLLPLTFTRPAGAIRVGILTIKEKWEHDLQASCRFSTKTYLTSKFTSWGDEAEIWINGRALPNADLISKIQGLKPGEGLRTSNQLVIAMVGSVENWDDHETIQKWNESDHEFIQYPEDIFSRNGAEIELDFQRITQGRTSAKLSASNAITGPGNLFIEEGARVEGALINPDGGSIYIGKDAEIMEGSLIRGSLALCAHGVLKLGTKIYGPTTIGPFSKVGGEVNNSVIMGYSNKGHDGFLGNSVIGEWCNLGADTNNSNLKNNYSNIKIWDYTSSRFRDTGLQFCGLIMGDHSKCGINTMFNTGTVIGVSSNIFGSGFPRNFIPSFAWGGNSGFMTYQLNKVFETAQKVFARRSVEFDESEQNILSYLFEHTATSRFWENKGEIKI
jgi:UDP-N-acetylglucosamine diphosphorylase/glucosamine-1-phosphate N-acetyltransferase